MIEANNLEINIDEIIERIRQEVIMHQTNLPEDSTTSTPNFPLVSLYLANIEALVNNADSRSSVRTKWPDKYNRFPFNLSKRFHKLVLKVLEVIFRDQREVNFSLIQALKEYLVFNQQLIEQSVILQAQAKVSDERLSGVDNRLAEIEERLGAMNGSLDGICNSLVAMEQRFSLADERLGTVDARLTGVDERLGRVDEHLSGFNDRLGIVDARLTGVDERLGRADEHLSGFNDRLGIVDARLTGVDERLALVENLLKSVEDRHASEHTYLKYDLLQQKRLVTLFLEEARQRLPEPFEQKQLQNFVNEDSHLLDAFYVAFEDQFRGSREKIIDRLKVYLPLIEEAKIGGQDSQILDLGCGRGEWLELLREFGYTARGLDINREMIQQCCARNLEVQEGDAISYLQSLSDASLGAVTGFHIIEHLPFEVLIRLFDESIRVLKPGGLVIFETPNPQNILTASYDFYYDPTHYKPLPSPMIKFVAESRGFYQVSIKNLNPFSDTFKVQETGSQIENRFNEYFYGPRDYAVIGVKV